MISGNQKQKQDEFEVEKKKPYQVPRVLASYDKKRLETIMEQAGVTGAGCSCACG